MKTWGHFGNAEVQGEASKLVMHTGDELFLFLDLKPTKPGHIVAWNFYTFTVGGWVGLACGLVGVRNFYNFTVGG